MHRINYDYSNREAFLSWDFQVFFVLLKFFFFFLNHIQKTTNTVGQ